MIFMVKCTYKAEAARAINSDGFLEQPEKEAIRV